MQIDDTHIVPVTIEVQPTELTPEVLAKRIVEATQYASAMSRKEKPFYKSFALSSCPFVHEHDGKTYLTVTVIVALVPDALAQMQAKGAFPFGGKG